MEAVTGKNQLNLKAFAVWSSIKKRFILFKATYGVMYIILLMVAITAVLVKLFLFYKAMGITSNLVLVWLVSCLLIFLLFASFKNKWIPAILFLGISFLMFADAAYSSFFNRYLSISMLGAASLLGGVQESVKEVVKPKFFALFADAALIFLVLVYGQIIKSKAARQGDLHSLNRKSDAVTTPTLNFSDNLANSASRLIRERIHPLFAILVLTMILSGFGNSYVLASLANQEFFSYHIQDMGNRLLSQNQGMYIDENDILISTGTYEKEKNGPLFGVAQGRNLIVVQIESLQNWAVTTRYNGQEITPNLNALIKDQSIYFDNYYEQRGSGNTSDAEYATNNSLYGSINSYTYGLFSDNYFRGVTRLGKISIRE